MIVSKKELQVVAKYIDTNNPKFELNYLYIDKEHLVSTDTRALAVIKHHGHADKDFYIHKSIVDLSIKYKKSLYFDLQPNKIVCLDEYEREIITISIESLLGERTFNYPDFQRIIPKEVINKIEFVEQTQIEGILAFNKVHIEPKRVPNISHGTIGITSTSTPVLIEHENIIIVMMPITDSFEELS
ncbi:MAG: hypothetical protein COA44_06040 [Arcobacter sp.]|nr:MAG: hypothetical protein COA44_06040 [Arcobacter sp.]